MSTFTHGNVSIEVDEDGFIPGPHQWNEEVVKAFAARWKASAN